MLTTLRKFFAFCGEESRRQFHISIALGIVTALVQAMRIPAAYLVITNLLDGSLRAELAWTSCAIIAVSVIASALLSMKSTMLQTRAGFQAGARKRIEIAEHLRYVPMGYFNDRNLGQIASVATNTMENLSNIGTRVVIMVTKGSLTTAVIILFLFFFDLRIALISLTGFVLFFLLSAGMQRVIRHCSARKIRADEGMVGKVLEYVQGIAEVKNFNLFGSRITEVNEAVDEAAAASFAMEVPAVTFSFLQSILNKLTGVAIVLASIAFYLGGSMSLPNAIMMILCSFMIFESLDQAGAYSSLLKAMDLCVDLGNDALSVPTMDIEGRELTPSHHSLAMENVDFSYGERRIIDGVSLTIPERQATAFVGPSGGGKTTLTQLLARFWDVDGGAVTLDGVNVKEYSYDSLMENFAFVFQSVYLFNDTIANNIAFGRPEATREQIEAAARKACCHDFISALPDGYDTIIGEGGASLSGGEKQRVSIARAVMKDAPVIILDEATANVDPENEEELVRAIEALTREKTVIMIAHRLKTVRHAAQILVVDRGRIVQRGTHDALMQQDGIYRNFIEERRKAVSWKVPGHSGPA